MLCLVNFSTFSLAFWGLFSLCFASQGICLVRPQRQVFSSSRLCDLSGSQQCLSKVGFFLGMLSVCSDSSHLHKFKSEPIQACMFSGGFYEGHI